MIQTYTFRGQGRQIDAAGVSFRYESGSDGAGETTIELRVDGIPLGTFEPGDQLDLPTPARRWEIVPRSSGCLGSVRIGMGRVTSAKLSGVVQTIDGGKSRSLAGGGLAAYCGVGSVASQFGQAQLWNTAGSGKNLIVTACSVASGAQGPLNCSAFLGQVQLSTYIGAGQNKKTGGAVSTAAQTRVENVGAGRAPSVPQILRNFSGLASQQADWKSSEPIVILPGYGLTVHHWGAAVDLGVSFEWFEE
ncbi:hypothetical protein EYS42_08770 [Aquabacterium lacunae]|uniref:Uncharacterized protein n=1 Tax=Aquabacterium lacunae TaxID=2528630 RepID=A0A4Q9H2N1_9BURK|nr:hypothetical protein [Aquabacterium lacunae]TBO31327.1 hypothetical protein EYS42_08770 [Aquabacterium lacunae]